MRQGWEKAEGPCEIIYTRRLKNGTVKGIDRGGQWHVQVMDGAIVPLEPRPGIHPLEAIDGILDMASSLVGRTAMAPPGNN